MTEINLVDSALLDPKTSFKLKKSDYFLFGLSPRFWTRTGSMWPLQAHLFSVSLSPYSVDFSLLQFLYLTIPLTFGFFFHLLNLVASRFVSLFTTFLFWLLQLLSLSYSLKLFKLFSLAFSQPMSLSVTAPSFSFF